MEYIAIEQFVDRYSIDTVINNVGESKIEELIEDGCKEIEIIGSNVRRFFKENRVPYDADKHSAHSKQEKISDLSGRFEYIEFTNVYLIPVGIKKVNVDDIMLSLNTKYGLLNLK